MKVNRELNELKRAYSLMMKNTLQEDLNNLRQAFLNLFDEIKKSMKAYLKR